MSWVDRLEQDGFAVIRGLFSADEIARVRAGFDRLLAIARTLSGTALHEHAQFVMEPEPFRLHRVVWCGGADPELLGFGEHERVLEVAATALTSDVLVQIIQQAHFKLPGDEVAYRWHQDASNRRYGTELWNDVDGRGSFVEIAVAVDPMTRENGPLRMIPGSHRQGFVAELHTGDLPPDAIDPSRAVDVTMDPGDAAVFGPFLVHGSGPNRGTVPRRLFLQGYALPGANRRIYPGCGLGVPRSRGLGK